MDTWNISCFSVVTGNWDSDSIVAQLLHVWRRFKKLPR